VVYVASAEYLTNAIWIARSPDGGRSFSRVRRVTRFRMRKSRVCFEGQEAGYESIPAQWKRCINPNPQLAVGSDGRIFLTFSQRERNRTQGVFVLTISPTLKVLHGPRRVGPPDRMPADQFWPALAVDRSTGDICVCYYDTTGDRHRRKTWFTCTVSRDGVHWAEPVRAAKDPSDEGIQRADLNEYGDYEAVVAANGSAHPFWTDSSDPLGKDEEILTAAIPASALRP
jgi:hypothetical protein